MIIKKIVQQFSGDLQLTLFLKLLIKIESKNKKNCWFIIGIFLTYIFKSKYVFVAVESPLSVFFSRAKILLKYFKNSLFLLD